MAAIQAIYAHHVLHGLATFEEIPPSTQELATRRAAVLALGLPYLTAERDGKVTGYCYATAYRPRSAYRFTIEDSIYVAPDAARQGTGSTLLRELIIRCERGPWRQMLAVIGNSANEGSIALHRRPVRSAAMICEPDPENGSKTTSPAAVCLRIGRAKISIGF